MSTPYRAWFLALGVLALGSSQSANAAATASTASTATITAAETASPPHANRDDAAALLAYDLADTSSLAAGHRYLDLKKAKAVRTTDPPRCRNRYACATKSLQIRVRRRDVLAGRITRLTLTWSADQKGISELEVGLAANGLRSHFDWLRPSRHGGGGRRLVLEVPSLDVERTNGLNIQITVAARTNGANALAYQVIDSLELELLP